MNRRGLTIGRLMLAVAFVVLVLALVRVIGGDPGVEGSAVIGGYLGLSLALGYWARRLGGKGPPGFAAGVFWVTAIGSPLAVVVADMILPGLDGWLLMIMVAGPAVLVIAGSGWAYASAPVPTGDGGRDGRVRWLVLWSAVSAVVMIVAAVVSEWPSRAVFRTSLPALERVADQVAAGTAPPPPVWAGGYRIRAYDVDVGSGNVALITNPSPGGRSGFVRARSGVNNVSPFVNLFYEQHLVGPWWYETED